MIDIKKSLENFYYWIYAIWASIRASATYRRDHYVPQLYLRRFEIPSKPGNIYVYTRGAKLPAPRSIKGTAQEVGFYIYRTRWTKKNSNSIDQKIYQLLENNVGPIITKLLVVKNKFRLSDKEESILASFIAYLYTRTPAFRNQIRGYILSLIYDHGVKIQELTRSFYVRALRENRPYVPQEAIVRNLKGNRRIFGIKQFQILASMVVAQHIGELIFRKNLNLAEVPAGKYFVTSDNPVLILDPNVYLVWPPLWNLEVSKALISLPISPKRSIMWGHAGGAGLIKEWDSARVDDMNHLMMCNGCAHLFSHESSPSIQNTFNY